MTKGCQDKDSTSYELLKMWSAPCLFSIGGYINKRNIWTTLYRVSQFTWELSDDIYIVLFRVVLFCEHIFCSIPVKAVKDQNY